MRNLWMVILLAAVASDCARNPGPAAPPIGSDLPKTLSVPSHSSHDPYRLWGQWTFFINDTHDGVDVVPGRQARLHLNALKFLEEYCTDCLKITQIKNNGDGTINLTVRITHPFKGHPEYTGFDVRGVIMFNGSYEFEHKPLGKLPLPNPCMISWRERGDPEVVDPDGYEYRWSPSYESGSDLPIFNYRPGAYSNGVPNGGLNAYLNFYSTPERHIFGSSATVERTYKIWLPPGESVVAGYAVEACWEPPSVTPVKDPITDFPISANTAEPYHYNVIVNNGDPVVYGSGCCGQPPYYCDTLRVEVKEWDWDIAHFTHITWYSDIGSYGSTVYIAEDPCDEYEDSFWTQQDFNHKALGNHRVILACFREEHDAPYGKYDWAFDLVDWTIIEE